MGNKVLVGDVISSVGKLVAKTLAYAGVETIICDNRYPELKQIILDEDPDLLLFFGMGSFETLDEFLRFIKANSPHLEPIILLFDILLESRIKQKYGRSICTVLMPASTTDISRIAIDRLTNGENMPLLLDVIEYMSAMGFSKMIAGFFYIAIGVEEGCLNPELMKNMTKRLYPRIAERTNTSSENIERSIRHYIRGNTLRRAALARIGCSSNSTNRKVILSLYKSFNGEK